MQLDLSLPIRITRDLVHRSGLRQLEGLHFVQKPDGSLVTDIDPLIERIVLEHLLDELGGSPVVVREEASQGELLTTEQIAGADTLVTVDGVDGTGRFIDHFNSRDPNPEWLIALTAVYRRDASTGLFAPELAFAYQPTTDCLFALSEGQAVLVERPLGASRVFSCDVGREVTSVGQARGSLDVWLQRARCPHVIRDGLAFQWGPSAYNFASILACCAVGRPPCHTQRVNFTSFHFTLWDFGLWPVLAAAGFCTVDFQDSNQEYQQLDVGWFGDAAETPGKIRRPLLIAPRPLLAELEGAVAWKPGFESGDCGRGSPRSP